MSNQSPSASNSALPTSRAASSPATDPNRASVTTWIAVSAAMIGSFMAILNIQITNASLLNIEGGIGTGVDNGSWISTSYLIGEIVVIPLTDFLSRVFSFRRYMIASAALFAMFSVACAFTHDLPSMIAMRGLQGFAGGVLIPMAFTLVLDQTAEVAAAGGACDLRAVRHLRAGDRADHRRLSHRELRLAHHLLRQRDPDDGHGGRALSDAGAATDAAQASQRGRLGRHLHDGDRPVGAADRARGRQQGRLVRLALHPAPGRDRVRSALRCSSGSN